MTRRPDVVVEGSALMVAYEVETEDLAGIGDQLRLQAEGLVSTRDGVNGASLEMLQTVAAGVTSTTARIEQVLSELEVATRAAASAATSAEWDGPDAEEFRSASAALLESISASEQRLQAAVAAHTTSTATLDSALRGTLGDFSAEAGRNHDLTVQLADAVVTERESLERAFDGTWAYAGEAAPAAPAPVPAPAPEPAPPPPPAEETDVVGEGVSLVLGLIPGVGTVKGIIEAATGEDLVTGRQLEPWERALGVLPYVGKLGAGARLLRGADRAAEAADAARAARAGAQETRAAAGAPGAARGEASVVGAGDPVDVTTGRVFLPQTDVELPGALPLVIGRRFDSGYRLGRSFGPGWASVLDERIEIDDDGVMLVRSNGSTLAYPLPTAGGEAVLPRSGTRWPLTLDADGVFRVGDPVTGLSYLYQAAPVSDRSAPSDAGPDAGQDGGPDAGPDAGQDGRQDVGPDAGQDGGQDGGPDAGPDAGQDAGQDGRQDAGRDPAWLVRVEDQAGRWWAVVRDAERDGVPLLVVHHGGYQLLVRTDDAGRVVALDVPDPDGGTSDARLGAYGYDDAGNLTGVVTATGGRLRFDYDDRGRMTGWVDSNDRAYEYSYDDQDRCLSQGAAGAVMEFTYAYADGPAAGQVQTTLTDPLGHRTRYVADASSRLLLEEVDPAGGVTRHRYDERANPLSRTDPSGATTCWTWDGEGRLTSTTDPLGATTTVQHDAGEGHDLVLTRPDGTTVTYQRDEAGRVRAVVDPSGAVTTIETAALDSEAMESAGLATAAVGSAGTAARGFGAGGSVVRVTDPLGAVTSTVLDPAGLPVRVTDAAGGTTSIVRDGLGRPVEVSDPAGTRTSTTWRIDGRPLTRTVVSGSERVSTESWAWDGEGNCTRHTDAAGRTSTTEFGDFDHPLARTAADGSRIEFLRDELMRPVRVVNQVGDHWTLEYDPAGRVVAETDYAGRRITREFDLAGRLMLEVNGAGQARSHAYDPAGRTASITSDGEVTRFGYDAVGRLVSAEAPGVALARTYDARGLLTAETINGATTTWRYDLAGRAVGRTTPAGIESTRGYDDAGRLVSLATGGHRLTLGHDLAGREVTRAVTSLTAGAAAVIASDWTPTGRLAARAVQAGSSLDRAAGADLWSVRYGYTPVGELAARVDSDLGASRYELDAAGRVTTVSPADGVDGGGGDHPDHPEQAGRAGTAYAYDAAGNLAGSEPAAPDGTGRTATGRAWAYLRGRLIRGGRDRFGYDDQGRLVRRRRALLSGGSRDWTYTWDAADRLTRVGTPDGSTWHYTYDPFGRRIAKRQVRPDGTAGEQVTFVWEGTDLIEQTATDPASGAVTSVTWDRMPDGTPATHTLTRHQPAGAPQGGHRGTGGRGGRADQDGGAGHDGGADRDGGAGRDGGDADPGSWDQGRVDSEFYALVTDLVGAPIRAVTPDGAAAWVARPSLWNPAAGAVSERGIDVPLRFPGQYADAETGLHYNLHRYYDPQTARYISPDPLGLAPAPNAYTYPANPTTHVDPLGLAPQYPGVTDTDLHAFGNAGGPRPPRPGNDFEVGADGRVVPQSGPLPRGASTFADPAQSGLTGVHHSIPAGTRLPEGFGVRADGVDVLPGSPHPPTHHTVYPTRPMSPQEFADGFNGLPWTRAGKIK